MYTGPHIKYPLFLSGFNEITEEAEVTCTYILKFKFIIRYNKNYLPIGSEFIYTEPMCITLTACSVSFSADIQYMQMSTLCRVMARYRSQKFFLSYVTNI
jgi:hypothetical protein